MKTIIDYRGQIPWILSAEVEEILVAINSADYSIGGLQEFCSIERKRFSDLVRTNSG